MPPVFLQRRLAQRRVVLGSLASDRIEVAKEHVAVEPVDDLVRQFVVPDGQSVLANGPEIFDAEVAVDPVQFAGRRGRRSVRAM